MNYTYAYIYTINAITLELNFFADMNIKLFTTLLQKSLLVSLYISYIYQRKIFFCPPKAWFSLYWSTKFDKLSLFHVPHSFPYKFSSLTKFLRFAAEQSGLSDC